MGGGLSSCKKSRRRAADDRNQAIFVRKIGEPSDARGIQASSDRRRCSHHAASTITQSRQAPDACPGFAFRNAQLIHLLQIQPRSCSEPQAARPDVRPDEFAARAISDLIDSRIADAARIDVQRPALYRCAACAQQLRGRLRDQRKFPLADLAHHARGRPHHERTIRGGIS